MTYCGLTDALSLIGITALRNAPVSPATALATSPTLSRGVAMLSSVSAEIDAHLVARNIDTASASSGYLGSVCATGTAAKIAMARWPAATGAGSDAGIGARLHEEYVAQLTFIDGGGIDDAYDRSHSVSHGFRDSAGTALSSSTTYSPITRETVF